MCWSLARWRAFAAIILILSHFALSAHGGGSGLNTLVVVNQNSSDSIALGNYYCERRQIPPENVLRINWPGGNTTWDAADFNSVLLQPLLQAIATRGLSNQIHYVVLSMDIPYSTLSDSTHNGTTSALFYGLKNTGATTNSFHASEGAFPDARPTANSGYSFLATMLTGTDLAQAKRLVDQGVTSDFTFPTAPVYLANSHDPVRRLRTAAYDHAIFDIRLRNDYQVLRTNLHSPSGLSGLFGFQTGLQNYSVAPNTFVPGAIADSLSSYGGVLSGNTEQTSLLAFIGAGAAGSYGTVSEPYALAAKFPTPHVYFYQARGFTIAESYYQSLGMPYQGLIVAEPLAAPFAQPGTGEWITPAADATLSGIVPLTVKFTAAPERPLQRVDLFVDGNFFQTLTNINPTAGNVVKMRINNRNVSYTIPVNATLASIAKGIAAQLNTPTISNLTKTVATAIGDRVELRFIGTNRPAQPNNLRIGGAGAVATSDGPGFTSESGSATAQTVFISGARPTFLDTAAQGRRTFSASGSMQPGNWLRLTVTKTNGSVVTVTYTNQTANASAAEVLEGLFERINATPELQGADGVVAEDFSVVNTAQSFQLTARSPGLKAAEITAALTSSTSSLFASPTTQRALKVNLTDLQPRNHIYVTAGASELNVTFPLNTTALPDGFHELTAVAYEGSHVRTQMRITLPVRIQNTPLNASLDLGTLNATNSVSGNYTVQVTATPGNISRITLYSTGGALETLNNQANATFSINGALLGVGTHPLYAVVQDTQGRQFRTDIKKVRFD